MGGERVGGREREWGERECGGGGEREITLLHKDDDLNATWLKKLN